MLYYTTWNQMRSKKLIIIYMRIVSCNLHRHASLVSKIMTYKSWTQHQIPHRRAPGPATTTKLIASIFLLDGNDHLVTDTFQ